MGMYTVVPIGIVALAEALCICSMHQSLPVAIKNATEWKWTTEWYTVTSLQPGVYSTVATRGLRFQDNASRKTPIFSQRD